MLNQLINRVFDYCVRESVTTTYKGIALCDINHDKSDDAAFIAVTKQALDLIEKHDQRRLRRLQNEVHYIINTELNSGGCYYRSNKSCWMDFGRYNSERSAEWYLYQYAGTLVHEATHGLLYTKGWAYTSENREQIERICHAEQHRFLARVKPEWREKLVKEFDASRWHFAWHASRWQQLWAKLKRIRESRRMAKQRRTAGPAAPPDQN